jgi:hypothetical protein
MSKASEVQKSFSDKDIKSQQVELKVGILGTVNPDGLPHLTMVSTLQACSPTKLVWGQFTEGLSKGFIRENPKAGFLVMSLDRNVWRGKTTFTHTEQSGPEYDWYNNLPMFRYNAYFGIHTVYYMDLLEYVGMEPLPMGSIVGAAIKTMIARNISRGKDGKQVLNLWTRQLFNKLDNLKFIAFIDEDGYPLIIPVIQAQARNQEQILFSTSAFDNELDSIPQGSTVAVFGLSLAMEDVLLRGQYLGSRRVGGFKCGLVQIQWVYNSMPPTPGQIYPEVELKAVTSFKSEL